jgi:pimeloyl-ACP methyl ester carboxylesterase
MKKLVKRAALAVATLVVIAGAGFVGWTRVSRYPAQPDAHATAQLAKHVNGWLVFEPAAPSTHGLIVYPGGLVDAEAYAPIAKELADRGLLVVITPVPLELAVLNVNAANGVREAFPAIATWAIAGHSLGGAMAAQHVASNFSGKPFQGLVLWGAPLSGGIDVSNLPIRVLSIYGSRDGLSPNLTATDRRNGLPDDAKVLAIEGGNHAMFGDYGPQKGDSAPTIDMLAARTQIADATAEFVLELGQ